MPQRLTLAPHIATYLRRRVALGTYSPGSARTARDRLRLFADSYGARPLDQLGPRAIERWLEELRGRALNTRASYFATVRAFCRWLVTERLIARDPTAGMLPPPRPRAVPRAQPADAVARTLAACTDDRERLILTMMVQMGMRRAEVAAARWEDHDPGAGLLLVHGKGRKERELPVPDAVTALLERQPRRRQYGPIIESRRAPGVPLSAQRVGIIAAQVMTRAGVKRAPYDGVSGHALRHTAGSDVLDRCHDLRVVQAMLGHTHLSSTSIYLRRASLPAMREAMEGREYQAAA